MTQPIITLRNINKIFHSDGQPAMSALHDINLEITSGEFFVIVGPSGSGKSTLLRIMSGLEKDFGGTLNVASDISRQDISFIFQQFALLPWLTIEENVALNLKATAIPPGEHAAMARQRLALLGLEKFSHAYPRELSGGMRQRVGIARALVRNPRIIFMDEPFSEVDSFTAKQLRQELLASWQERKPTIVMVTHMIEEAVELSDRIAVLTDRPGRIEKIVTNHLARPRQKRSQEFYRLADEIDKLVTF